MRNELYSSAGIYAPTFFNMSIDTRESLQDILKLSPAAAAAFIHEYTHYLQDIATTYGLRNIIMVADFMKTVNMDQRESESRIMKIPYQIDKAKIRGAHYNGPIQRLLTGTINKVRNGEIQEITKRIEKKEVPPQIKDIEVVEIYFEKPYKVTFDLGSCAITESMAYLIEQSIYPGVLPKTDDFCYYAAASVGEFIYPEFANNPLNLIALCDASLMYGNPGAVFYDMLKKMKEEAFIPSSYVDIYHFVFASVQEAYALVIQHWNHIFNNHTQTAIFQLIDYFTIEAFEANKAWIEFTLLHANMLRNEDVSFLVKMVEGGPISGNPIFKNVFSRVGMPITSNSDGEAWFATNAPNQEKIRSEFLWVVNQIYNVYINSRSLRRCGLEQWCREGCKTQGIEDYTDYRCFENPWDRHKDAKLLCPFSQVWRAWGMEAEVPTV